MINEAETPYIMHLFYRTETLASELHQKKITLSQEGNTTRKLWIRYRLKNILSELYSWSDAAISTDELLRMLQQGSTGYQPPVWGTTHDRKYNV